MKILHPTDLYPYQETAIKHVLRKDNAMLWIGVGLGKQQPNSELILTPSGWTTMGSLKVGDLVTGSDGRGTQVLGVFPQGKSEVVRVTFTDGSWCRVGWDHLWYVQNWKQRSLGTVGHVMTTRQIYSIGISRDAGKTKDRRIWHIPMVQPVHYDPVELPIEPYLLGVILGDGSIFSTGYTTVCTDQAILESCKIPITGPHKTCDYVAYGLVPGVSGDLVGLGLSGCRSWEKFIPDIYMKGTPEDRLSLLQGLMDTDGSPMDKGGAEYSSTSEALTAAVVELTQSLGGVALRSGPRITNHQGGEGRPSWRVNVKLPTYMTPFRLARKRDKWIRPTKYLVTRMIESIEAEGWEESTCIKVAAADSLYVTRGFILTHNTTICQTAVKILLATGDTTGVLVVAPKRVCELVWAQEAERWSHLHGLTFSHVLGSAGQRALALRRKADIYLVNYENLTWLDEYLVAHYISKGREMPFNMVIYDEVTKLKNSTSHRSKALNNPRITVGHGGLWPYFKRHVGLTGEPAANGYADLHGQYLAVDGGARLGRFITDFRQRYLTPLDMLGRLYAVSKFGRAAIHKRIEDITLEMSSDDYLDLPPVVEHEIWVDLPVKTRGIYAQMEKLFFMELESGREIEAQTEATRGLKLLQVSNGACYDDLGNWHAIHDAKLDALDDLIEELNGEPLLLAYCFRHDAERIAKRFPKARFLSSQVPRREAESIVAQWGKGDVPLLCGHPASMSWGLNLGRGSHLCWFGRNWSLEMTNQFNGRLTGGHRRQTRIIQHYILTRDTMDLVVHEVLANKVTTQEGLKAAIRKYQTDRRRAT